MSFTIVSRTYCSLIYSLFCNIIYKSRAFILGTGKTIERRFECDGPFILSDAFVGKGAREKEYPVSSERSLEKAEKVKQFIDEHLKNGWVLRHVRYLHKDVYGESKDKRDNIEFDHNPVVKGEEFIQLGMPLAIKYKVTRTLEAI